MSSLLEPTVHYFRQQLARELSRSFLQRRSRRHSDAPSRTFLTQTRIPAVLAPTVLESPRALNDFRHEVAFSPSTVMRLFGGTYYPLRDGGIQWRVRDTLFAEWHVTPSAAELPSEEQLRTTAVAIHFNFRCGRWDPQLEDWLSDPTPQLPVSEAPTDVASAAPVDDDESAVDEHALAAFSAPPLSAASPSPPS